MALFMVAVVISYHNPHRIDGLSSFKKKKKRNEKTGLIGFSHLALLWTHLLAWFRARRHPSTLDNRRILHSSESIMLRISHCQLRCYRPRMLSQIITFCKESVSKCSWGFCHFTSVPLLIYHLSTQLHI